MIKKTGVGEDKYEQVGVPAIIYCVATTGLNCVQLICIIDELIKSSWKISPYRKAVVT